MTTDCRNGHDCSAVCRSSTIFRDIGVRASLGVSARTDLNMLLKRQPLISRDSPARSQPCLHSVQKKHLRYPSERRCSLIRAAQSNTMQPRTGAVTPHSGYHYDGSNRRFFEGWYFNVSDAWSDADHGHAY